LKCLTFLAVAECNVTTVSFKPVYLTLHMRFFHVFIADNIAALADIARSFTFQAILNASVSVDTFFLLRFVVFK
jgi:hypothetical protein